MKIKFVLAGVAIAALALLSAGDAFAARISFNLAGNTDGGNPSVYPIADAGTFFEGEHLNDLNDVALAAGTLVDSSGSTAGFSSLVSVDAITGNAGINGNDTAPAQLPVGTTYGNGVGLSLAWGGSPITVTVRGLDPSTQYAVGVVAAADDAPAGGRNRTMDISFNGSLAVAGINEQFMVTQPAILAGTTDANGDLAVLINNQSDVIGWQALFIDQDLSLVNVPEPATAGLALISLFSIVAMRRRS